MASQAHLEKMQLRQNYRNLWHTDLLRTIQADTPLHRVYPTCFANELSMMICQDTHVVLVTCPAVTQHKVEMDKRDGKFGPQPAMAVPPAQQMSRIDQSVPPSVGYPPQPAYGQPYGYPPAPPPSQGYPATGYPPAAYPPAGYPPSGYSR